MHTLSTYYAFYDISNDNVRNEVIRILKDVGFSRIQESVFCGTISSQQKKDLIENIRSKIIDEVDSFLLILSCKQCFGKISAFGKKMDLNVLVSDDGSVVL